MKLINKQQTNVQNHYNESPDQHLYKNFIKQAIKFKRLSKQEEKTLGLKIYKTQNHQAIKTLILHNMRLSIKIAYKYKRSWTNIMDLIQEASIGIAIAAKKWDPHKKTRFGTYASYWIKAQLTKFLMTNARLIHTANTKIGRKIYFNLPKIKRKLISQGKHPTPELIAKEINEDPKEVTSVITRINNNETSINNKFYNRTNNNNIIENLITSKNLNAENLICQYQINKTMNNIIIHFTKTLNNERDITIWTKHLISDNPISLVDLGKQYNVSKQRIFQLANKIKQNFRCYIIDTLGPNTNLSWLFS